MTSTPSHLTFALIFADRKNKRCHALARKAVICPEQRTYQEQMASRIAAKHVAEAKERGIPLWMLRGFPALSSEPDQDDPIDFL